MTTQFDIIVAGGGLVGATAANLFTNCGFNVAMVSGPVKPDSAHNPRVSAITLAAQKLFTELHIWGLISPPPYPYKKIQVWDDQSRANIYFRAADIGQQSLGYIVENQSLTQALHSKLTQNDRSVIFTDSEIIDLQRDHQLNLTIRDHTSQQTLSANLLVAADGINSPIRKLCGIPVISTDLNQYAITASILCKTAQTAAAYQWFLPSGPVALLPMRPPNNSAGRYALVWSCTPNMVDELMDIGAAQFRAKLLEIVGQPIGEISECRARCRFKLRHHHAQTYIANSVALIGDAAHAMHPLAGLGANLGFMDAAALAEVIAAAGKHIGRHSVLRRYERWRRPDNEMMLAAMLRLKQLFTNHSTPLTTARGLGVNLIDSATPLKSIIAKFATGIYGDLPEICRIST